MFKKTFLFFFPFLISLTVLFLQNSSLYSFSLPNFIFPLDSSLNFNYTFCFDFQFWSFCFMVGLVFSVVLLYSEFYVQLYNVKKFFFLMLSFFVVMLVLSSSGSFLVFISGWDGLGVTSIGLIMFYPNKIGMFNSILTMFFNRLGDVLVLVSMGIFMCAGSHFFLFPDSILVVPISFLLLVCSFTKSAQFPVSSWLPAAMSAPTPISAMVHSSTLVTAGIYLISLFLPLFFSLSFFLLIFYYCLLSFLVGGFLSSLEVDYKKMVAFSTMSQVSLIIFFLCALGIFFSFTHMMFHAIFKTLLFCCVGVIFGVTFGDQIKTQSKVDSNVLSAFLFFSVYSMLGLMFCSSFFSKDLVLEFLLTDSLSMVFTLLILGSIFTIFYCCKILFSLSWSIYNFSSFLSNFFFFKFIVVFSLICLYIGNFFLDLMFLVEPFLFSSDFFFMLFTFLLVLLFVHKFSQKVLLSKIFLDVGFMKAFFYERLLEKFFFSSNFSFFFSSDRFLFKPVIFLNSMSFSKFFYFGFSLSFYLFLFFFMLIFI